MQATSNFSVYVSLIQARAVISVHNVSICLCVGGAFLNHQLSVRKYRNVKEQLIRQFPKLPCCLEKIKLRVLL